MVNISFLNLASEISSLVKTTVLVIGMFEGSNQLEDNGLLGNDYEKAISITKNFQFFNGQFAEIFPLTLTENNKVIMIIGLGKREELNENKLLKVGGIIYSTLENMKIKDAAILATNSTFGANVAYGALLRSFKFYKYFSKRKEENTPKVQNITVLLNHNIEETQNLYNKLKTEGESVFLARSFVSEPPNILYPEAYAAKINEELQKVGVNVKILDEEDMKKHGMMALLGVGQGSHKSSKLVVMEWNGGKKDDKPIALVGKGVTFDTGGISLKPSKAMWDMKYDMAGSASVVGAIRALAARKAKVNVVGVVGLVENAIGGNAQRPSDIVVSMSGQTIEVLNTDAEGRLVLADALWYTQEMFSPKLIIDLATLTGAIIVALGNNQYAGIFSNNDLIATQLIDAGNETDEKLWRFPLSEAYDKMINSSVADMQNISTKGYGADSITASQFLQRFVNQVPWAHLDIAGTAWSDEGLEISPKGATGFGVRLLNRFISKYYE
ncbi:leucyl aminopeptidase [Neoehrlichia mikurensis]|uniref:Probable cytosol aminopeptidase n=1 Tax=Neoehrlichia mikurensis TaxID=89586 RepID=A0A9Q9F5A2_9RICK|nr:leucyl aminopeptidase [Neoehrlichia mikurensis]QXK91759.1 leucyl aminopeptidase [Neoehrlichia mikurensis]QXK92971.1 leucyl aminopeptidase [Neoehrlichia mikurensis]QXK93449.1 leucyl aminopeptidase [Neoehrlichia mikurensis]UTO55596.1 leucyl aminopeptidase [Neoehrlichia mikurensis]UTO56517.1 leucyl aminopeptidase [Neoehrlichia mikurensis]